ncbi:Kinesin- motor protein [Sorochytrium milnesiophthora]
MPPSPTTNKSPSISRIASMPSLRGSRPPTAASSGSGSASSLASSSAGGDPRETNIQVVLRCRPRNEREIRENSAMILNVPSPSSTSTSATTSLKTKELQIRQQPNERASFKTYTFDRVFGPEATQETVYEDVAAPILHEVLAGYNCTIFAYGQTGTGKTHTMEGSLQMENGTYSAQAGIVPRVLFKLFEALELQDVESSVKVSCIELYNEELRDLLSPNDTKLQIRDGAQKGLVVGLEEVSVESASDSIAVLQRGSLKRQIAATSFNEKSSRSHCVFMITVRIREMTSEGEEVLKIGKLNLVDLAGSENIGRSGAENMRAREASDINKSLLALGRVINALVDRVSHIPYRDSKLTRLLQDSLGGSTKTCIIATVSPARCNFDETMSTLDYAHRAKNIRNKPQINQRMSKKVAIKEYVHEIEKLKQDLQSARDKNGIILSPERYKELTEDCEAVQAQMVQMRKDVEEREEHMRQQQEVYDRNMQLFEHAKVSLQSTKVHSLVQFAMHTPPHPKAHTKAQLAERTEQLRTVEASLEEHKVVNQAHAQHEASLNGVIRGLIATLTSTTTDVEQLHAKIDRKTQIQQDNKQTVTEYKDHLVKQLGSLENALRKFEEIQQGIGQSLQGRMRKFAADFREYQASTVGQLQQCSLQVRAATDSLSSATAAQSTATADELTAVRDASAAWLSQHEEAVAALTGSMTDAVSAISSDVSTYNNQAASWFADLQSYLTGVFGGMQVHIDKQTEQIRSLEDAVQTYCSDSATSSQNEQDALAKLQQDCAGQAEQLQAVFKARLADMVDELMNERTSAINNIIGSALGHTQQRHATVKALGTLHQERVDGLLHTTQEHREQVVQAEQGAVSRVSAQATTTSEHGARVEASLQEHQSQSANALTALHEQASAYVSDAQERLSTTSATVQDTAASNAKLLDSVAMLVGTQMDTFEQDCQRVTTGIVTDIESWQHNMMTDNCVNLATGFKQKTNELRKEVVNLAAKRLRDDMSTGDTPRKRHYKYPTAIDAVLDPAQVLARHRETGSIEQPKVVPADLFDPEIVGQLETSAGAVALPAEEGDQNSPSRQVSRLPVRTSVNGTGNSHDMDLS